MKQLNFLLINPWIYDFAAYDMWLKPWGLLKISSILKKAGHKVFFVDALDRHHPLLRTAAAQRADGRGKFEYEEKAKPGPLKNIPRKYKRYGIPLDVFRKSLPGIKPDHILVSSSMTYWYPGVFEAIKELKQVYPGSHVILGGIYATLCYDHAVRTSGADLVIRNKDLAGFSEIFGGADLSFKNILNEKIDHSPYQNASYAVLRLSLGCPFDCSYCAQKKLGPGYILKDREKAFEEINELYIAGIKNFVFYDDALLSDGDYIKDYLGRVAGAGIDAAFFTPNGLHARFMTADIARLMKKTNFINPVLSLETSDPRKTVLWHDKVSSGDIEKAATFLREAGYKKGEYTVYALLGAPGSDLDEVKNTADYIHSLGAKVSLSEYSPVPGTSMAGMVPDVEQEPLLQNNSIFPSLPGHDRHDWQAIMRLKNYAQSLNATLTL